MKSFNLTILQGAKWQQDQDINKHNEEEPDIICGMCGGNAALCDGC